MKKYKPELKESPESPQSAAEMFNQNYKFALTQLKQIEKAIQKMSQDFKKEPTNWGYAGSIRHVKWGLVDILEFLVNQ